MSRYYDCGGMELPSVTTICGQLDKSDALMRWASKCTAEHLERIIFSEDSDGWTGNDVRELCANSVGIYKEKSAEAMDTGSNVHHMCEKYMLKQEFGKTLLNDEAKNAWEQFLSWVGHYKPKPIRCEYQVYDLFEGYAGTADLLCEIDGKHLKGYSEGEKVKVVVDYKTGGEYREHFYQLNAYWQHSEADTYARLCLPKNGDSYTFKLSPNQQQDSTVFSLLCQLWWESHPRKNGAYKKAKAQLTTKELIDLMEEWNAS